MEILGLGGKNQSMDCSKFEWPTEHLRDCFPPDKWHLACSTIQSYLTGISFWYELGAEAAINRCHTFRRSLDHSSHAIYKLWWFLDFMYVLCLCNEEKKSGCTNVWIQKYFKVIINMYIYKIEFSLAFLLQWQDYAVYYLWNALTTCIVWIVFWDIADLFLSAWAFRCFMALYLILPNVT